jgi:hypothetical protein
MITNSKMADKNVSHFSILISHSRPKYIGNMADQNHKWMIFWSVIFEWVIITLGDIYIYGEAILHLGVFCVESAPSPSSGSI